jgi:hypothetical protein
LHYSEHIPLLYIYLSLHPSLLSLSLLSMSDPPPLCDLCDIEVATFHCAQCHPNGIGNLCADDDAALHKDAKKKLHIRVPIGGDGKVPAAAVTGTTANVNSLATAVTTTQPATSTAAVIPAASIVPSTSTVDTDATPSTPVKMVNAPVGAGHSRNASATKLWASARLKLATVRQFSRVKSLFSSAGGAAPKQLSISTVPSAAASRRTSLLLAVAPGGISSLHCQLCSSAAATIWCDTCHRDTASSGSTPLYCTNCDITWHTAEKKDFHFRQSVEEAQPAIQIQAEIETAKLQAQAAAAAAILTHGAALPPLDSIGEPLSAGPLASPVQRTMSFPASSAANSRRGSALELLSTRSNPSQANSATSNTSEEAAAALKIQSMYRGSAVRRTASRDITQLQLKSVTEGSNGSETIAPALAALAVKSAGTGTPRVSISTNNPTILPTSSPSSSPSPSIRPLSGINAAAAAATWGNPAASPLSATAASRSTSRAVSRVNSRHSSPVGTPLPGSGRTVIGSSTTTSARGGVSVPATTASSSTHHAHSTSAGHNSISGAGVGTTAMGPTATASSVTDTSIALFMAKLEVLENRLRKDAHVLQSEKAAFELSKIEQMKEAQKEIELIKATSLAEIKREHDSALESLKKEVESIRAQSSIILKAELDTAREAVKDVIRLELNTARAEQKALDAHENENRANREKEFVTLLQHTTASIGSMASASSRNVEEKEPTGVSASISQNALVDLKRNLRAELHGRIVEELSSLGLSSSMTATDRQRIRSEEVNKLLRLVPPRAAKILAVRLAEYEQGTVMPIGSSESDNGTIMHHQSHNSRLDSKPLTREELDLDDHVTSSTSGRWTSSAHPQYGLASSMPSGYSGMIPHHSLSTLYNSIDSGIGLQQPRSYFHAILNNQTAASTAAQGKQPFKPAPPPAPLQPAWNGQQSAPAIAVRVKGSSKRPASAVARPVANRHRSNNSIATGSTVPPGLPLRISSTTDRTLPSASSSLISSPLSGLDGEDDEMRFLVDSTIRGETMT